MKIAMNSITDMAIYRILNLSHTAGYTAGGAVCINKGSGYAIAELVAWVTDLLLCLVYLSARVTS